MAKAKKTTKEKKIATTVAKKKTLKALPRGIIATMNSAVTKLNRVQQFINARQ